MAGVQDKSKEINFFKTHAQSDDYDVFHPETNDLLIDTFERICTPARGEIVADLGCGSGIFTKNLQTRGFSSVGMDLCVELLEVGQQKFPDARFAAGDVEHLPFASESVDAVLLSGIVHHLPDPAPCAAEVKRILKPGGRFMAFDPNRANPFMYLYRDKSSPFYSAVGVTENEGPISASVVSKVFSDAGLIVETEYLSGLKYRYIASGVARKFLAVYNFIDGIIFRPGFMRPMSAFVITSGVKPG
ncbi:MAG: class I SAM-dependent methyltransferase [Rhodospirillaceae bacterium]|jgi:SAM-dependent methyltransferase|nr:class I SAM-dependent methyltransferase [Rhodospirillaceae bacterium]MBT5515673.1 class I SAM-dependent methyltransferase [Rhodospirillaceae bacterium]MBT6087842.1 class I SAM-dependent methyltransferase [Rhodospirillaceae bacterium]